MFDVGELQVEALEDLLEAPCTLGCSVRSAHTPPSHQRHTSTHNKSTIKWKFHTLVELYETVREVSNDAMLDPVW